MRLPTCVKVEGKLIGCLVTYEGAVGGMLSDEIREVGPEEIMELTNHIRWSGRLWRDDSIPQGEALDETHEFVREFPGLRLMYQRTGFGLFSPEDSKCRVNLIGVRRYERHKGIARALIKHAVANLNVQRVIAGTYDDNDAARRLYIGLGMGSRKIEHVFHR